MSWDINSLGGKGWDLSDNSLLSGDLMAPTPAVSKKAAGIARETLPVFVEPKSQPMVPYVAPSPLSKVVPAAAQKTKVPSGDLLDSYGDSGFDFSSLHSQSQGLVATQSVTQQVVKEQMKKGGILSVTSNIDLQNISREVQRRGLADIDAVHASINGMIREYEKDAREANRDMADKRKDIVLRSKEKDFDVARETERVQLVVHVTKATLDLLYQSAKQFIEVQGLARVERMANYNGMVALVFDQKLKEMQLLKDQIAIAKDTEKHQLEIFLGYHNAYLKEEKERFDELLRYIGAQADIQEKLKNGERAAAQQEFDNLLKMEEALVERYKVEGDRQMALEALHDKQELALRDADQRSFAERFNQQLEYRKLELSSELQGQEMNNDLRIQLLEVGIKEAIAVRQSELDLRKVDSEEATEGKRIESAEKTAISQMESDERQGKTKWDAKEKIGIQKSKDEAETKQTELKEATKQKRSEERTKRITGVANAVGSAAGACTVQ